MNDSGTPRSDSPDSGAGCLSQSWRIFARPLFIVFLICALVRLLFKDTLPHPGPLLFYLAPLPVLAILALPECLLQIARRRPGNAILTGLCCLLPVGFWIHNSYRQGGNLSDERTPDSIRLVFWTADNYQFATIAQAAKELTKFDADVLILNEGVIDLGTQQQYFSKHFPEHEIIFLPWDRFALIRGSLLDRHFSHTESMDGTLVQLIVKCREACFITLLFDHRSDLSVPRKHALHALTGTVRHFADQPLLLMGDFNTPADSAYLAPIRQLLTDPFDSTGSGWKETWPVPLPLLTLDQLWISPAVAASRTFHARLGNSLHEAIVIDFRLRQSVDMNDLHFPAPYPSQQENKPISPSST